MATKTIKGEEAEVKKGVIDLKWLALMGGNKNEFKRLEEPGPLKITAPSLLTAMIKDFTIKGPQFQNAVFMLRQMIENKISPPYQVYTDTWPDYEVVNLFRERNTENNDDQSTIIYRQVDKMINMLVHVNIRHLYGRSGREVLLRGIKEEHLAEFRYRMAEAGYEIYDISMPYRILSLYDENLLYESSEKECPLYDEIQLDPDCEEMSIIQKQFPDIRRDQLVDYVKNFPSIAQISKRTNEMVAYGLITGTGAMEHINVIPKIYNRELRTEVIVSLVGLLKTEGLIDLPFIELQDGDDLTRSILESIGFKEVSVVCRRAMRIRRQIKANPIRIKYLPFPKKEKIDKTATSKSINIRKN